MVVGNVFDSSHKTAPVQLGDFSVPAAVVHSHLVDLLRNGRRTFDTDLQGAPKPLVRLLRVGGRYAPRSGGELDSSGSSAEDLSLASELMSLVQRVLGAPDTELDMKRWTENALTVIATVERAEATVDDLAELKAFAATEMLETLERIIDLPARAPAE